MGGGRGRGRGKGTGKAMKKMIMKTLVDAHCDHASNGDATKDAACEKCFAEAVPSKSLTGKGGRGGRRGGRGKRAAKEKGVAACGTEISAMAPGNMEALKTVVECFDDRLEKENAERCLGEATSTELQ